jgi:uncharacterized protein
VILYLDTSALVKRYFKEPDSDEVAAKWQEAAEIATSSVAYAEARASFCRKKREANLENKILKQLVKKLRQDWPTLVRIQVTDALNPYIDKALESHPLRGLDAIHLASAMVLQESFPKDLLFICFDQKLTQAAKAEGIQTFPTKTP